MRGTCPRAFSTPTRKSPPRFLTMRRSAATEWPSLLSKQSKTTRERRSHVHSDSVLQPVRLRCPSTTTSQGSSRKAKSPSRMSRCSQSTNITLATETPNRAATTGCTPSFWTRLTSKRKTYIFLTVLSRRIRFQTIAPNSRRLPEELTCL